MIKVSTAEQVRALDAAVIDGLGLPGIALMELASRGVADAIRAHHLEAARRGVVVVCGGGNNGGDGYGCARWLHQWGLPVRLLSLKESSSGDAAVMRRICGQLGIDEVAELGDCGLIVDAVFGTGLSREVTGAYADALEEMAQHGADVVAVDVPSGLNSDTGIVHGIAVPAVRTVTFGRPKQGFYGEPGADYVGEVDVVDIGLEAVPGEWAAEIPEPDDVHTWWPRRAGDDHKTRSGHLLVVAGSAQMAGAAVLACRGALAAGTGLVSLCIPRGAWHRLGALPPEVMVLPGGEGDWLEPVDVPSRITALAVGPGLGSVSSATEDWLREIWQNERRPLVYDADALRCAEGGGPGPRVITPHAGEAARLLNTGAEEVQEDRFSAARSLAVGRVALLKGRHTLVAETGRPLVINPTGNPVLATGGSGDVLTGVIGALLARAVAPRDAASLAAWVHGRAADRLAARRADGWTASDVADEIPKVTP